jgi:hypothetical protein
MPTTITTEQARVALAHRGFDQLSAETERKFKARMLKLKADPRATSIEAFEKLCLQDDELLKLTVSQVLHKAWRDGNITSGAIATIEDDGRVRWTLPQYV